MAKYTQALALRSSLVNQLNEIYDLAETSKTQPLLRELFKRRFARAQKIFERFVTNHEIVVNAVANQTTPNLDNEEKIRRDFFVEYDKIEQIYLEYWPDPEPAADRTINQSHTENSSIRLPKITLREFNGDFSAWTAFIQSFNSVIHNNSTIANVDKFQYLLSCLSKEPLNLIKSLTISEENYQIAYDLLINRYDDKRKLAGQYWKKIQCLSKLKSESPKGLRDLLDSFRENRSALLTLKLEPSMEDFIWSNLLLDKLDQNTHRLFEENIRSLKNSDITFEKLEKFIESQCRILDSVVPTSIKRDQSSPKSFIATQPIDKQDKNNSLDCVICQTSAHSIYKCDTLHKTPSRERFTLIKQHRLCLNCLRPNHMVQNCPSKSSCRHCNSKHHTLLHFETKVQNTLPLASTSPNSQASTPTSPTGDKSCLNTVHALSTIKTRNGNSVLLATALISVMNAHGNLQQIRCLLDPGSQVNFITKGCVNKLGLRYNPSGSSISGIGGYSSVKTYGSLKCSVHSKLVGNNSPLNIEALVLQNICPDMPPCTVTDYRQWSHISNLTLADPHFYQSQRIDMLLGGGIFPSILRSGKIEGDQNSPSALNTIFGWVLMGNYNSNLNQQNGSSFLTIHNDQSIHDTLKLFWEVEEPPHIHTKSVEEELCEEHFLATTSRNENGRYTVSLPFKNSRPIFKGSFNIAKQRFLLLEKRLSKNPQLYISYKEFMQDYLDQNHMTHVDSSVPDGYFIPHHCILRPESLSTKLRVVFDASAKDDIGLSLNDTLYPGPKILNDLLKVILNFRQHSVVLTADIRQMYRQILVNSNDRCYQKILFRFDPTQNIQTYKLNTVTYGVSCAPYLAIRVIKQLAQDGNNRFPLASLVLLNDIYVDDIVTGCHSVSDALELQTQLINLLNCGGFELRKWSSNIPEVVEALDPQLRSEGLSFDHSSDSTIKILGLRWFPYNDCFSYHVHVEKRLCTKRSILSEISKIYDPLGFLSAITLFAKHLIQYLWSLKVDWDQKPPDDVIVKWEQFIQELPLVTQLKIPRQITMSSSNVVYQIHAFCDGSEKGYAAVVYLRSQDSRSDDIVSVKLVMAKSKVAPLRKLSIPRLELCAAQLLAKLVSFIANSYSSVNISNIYAWTDSTIVLSWLRSSPHLRKTFVSNRVAYIQNKLPSVSWRHVATTDNPADGASRGMLPQRLINYCLFWNGPHWLRSSQDHWPSNNQISSLNLPSDEDKTISLVTAAPNIENIIDKCIEKYSSLSRLQNVISYIIRFSRNCRHRENRHSTALTQTEINDALLVIIKHVQELEFSAELHQLKSNKLMSKPFQKLNPFLDAHGLLRVGGRLSNSNLSYSTKYPILLPKSHKLTMLIVRYYHKLYLHPGIQTLSFILRQKFWIFSIRQVVKGYTSTCHTCFRVKPNTFQPLMGDLPASRISQLKAFQNVGVDFGGPFHITIGKYRGVKTQKAYICLFVCFTTRALHLELVSDLSTNAFIAALRRFVARRGRCTKIFSDCGTNFLGTHNQLIKLMKSAVEEEKITWSLNPPTASHFGGLWEAGIKSVKSHLIRVIGEQILTYEEFNTVLVQIEAVLNSRPLTPLSSDPNDLSALTPGHFLTLQPLSALPENLESQNLNPLSRWKLLQNLHRDFWKRWQIEYLNTLQQRQKWTDKTTRKIEIGDLVLINNDTVPPLKWHYGRVLQTHPGNDGIIRVVTLKTTTGTLKRPLNKVCPLPKFD